MIVARIFLGLALLFSNSAQALFDAQLLVGQQSGKIGSESVSGSRTDIAAHLDPIPLIPIGFGLNISTLKLDSDVVTGDLEGVFISPEIYAWFPFGSFKPYAKLGVVASGALVGDASFDVTVAGTTATTTQKVKYEYSGSYMGVGLIYSFIPLVGILFEYNTVVGGKIKPDLDNLKSEDVEGSAFLVGVEVGL